MHVITDHVLYFAEQSQVHVLRLAWQQCVDDWQIEPRDVQMKRILLFPKLWNHLWNVRWNRCKCRLAPKMRILSDGEPVSPNKIVPPRFSKRCGGIRRLTKSEYTPTTPSSTRTRFLAVFFKFRSVRVGCSAMGTVATTSATMLSTRSGGSLTVVRRIDDKARARTRFSGTLSWV